MGKEKITDQAMYDFYGKMPLKRAIPLGLQHVLAMFVGNLTPLLIICGACGISGSEEFAHLQVCLLQNAMFVAGVVTLVQLYAIGPIGGKVPIIMGTSSGFIGVFKSVADTMGGGLATYGAIMGASILGGLFEGVLGFFIKPLRKFFPAVVTGTVVLSIGLSLISVGINSFGGGSGAKDFGSMENLLLAIFVLVVILIVKHWTNGMASNSAILIGIIAGYIAAFVMSLVLPTTGITADGAEYTKAWVLNWDKVAQASWISIPEFLPVKPVFDARAIAPILIMFIVTAVETVGDISGVIEGGMNREATDKELSGGVICDGIGSSFAALFGILPNTSFSQNVGLVTMTKVVNRTALATGAVFLILCGLVPNLAANKTVTDTCTAFAKSGKKVAAICAAPSVLASLGLLEGKNATAHAGFQDKLAGAHVLDAEVVVDGNITTSYGLGGAIPFALELVRQLAGQAEADRIRNAIAYRH